MNREPVLVILNGLAAVLSLTLVALNALGVTHLEPGAVAATVAAVTAACNLFAAAIRAAVVPVGVHAEQVAQALATPVPGQVLAATVGTTELIGKTGAELVGKTVASGGPIPPTIHVINEGDQVTAAEVSHALRKAAGA